MFLGFRISFFGGFGFYVSDFGFWVSRFGFRVHLLGGREHNIRSHQLLNRRLRIARQDRELEVEVGPGERLVPVVLFLCLGFRVGGFAVHAVVRNPLMRSPGKESAPHLW